ncbi:hypothetical protein EYF80_055264 [Liparis tanakae]|uniref:Uncharacterized protein n=1 Tax=Liparis tanakae TaxID=230148 RepID=A0A4Z2F0A5_9TELE|nr:hypothetical protein EYF80_055264 [Liparis tanakae]
MSRVQRHEEEDPFTAVTPGDGERSSQSCHSGAVRHRVSKYPQTIRVCAGESLKSQVKSCLEEEILNRGTGGADKGKEGAATTSSDTWADSWSRVAPDRKSTSDCFLAGAGERGPTALIRDSISATLLGEKEKWLFDS